MSYLLETLGRGLLGRLVDAFEHQLPNGKDDDIETLKRRHRDVSTSYDLTVRLAAALLREMRLSGAREAFLAAKQLEGPKHVPALGLACIHDELGQTADAIRCLDEALRCVPDDPAILFASGLCHEHHDDLPKACERYLQAIDACPQLRNAYERRAAVAVRQGDWDTARECYAQLAFMEPDDLNVLLTLGNLQLQCGAATEAIDSFQRALLVEPESTDDGIDALGDIEDEMQLIRATNTVEKLVDKYPGVAEFRIQLGDLYVKGGDDQGAVEQYQTALQLHPGFLEATVKLGTQHLRHQRYSDAAQHFNQAVELNDRLLTAFVGLGVAQYVARRDADAQSSFDLAAGLSPNSTLLFTETNRLHLKALRCHAAVSLLYEEEEAELSANDQLLLEAVRRYRDWLVRQPQRADLHYRHAMLLRQFGDVEEALGEFQQALQINPSYFRARIKMGITLRELGRTDEATKVFAHGLQTDSKTIELHYQLGLLFARESQFDLAVENYENTLGELNATGDFRYNVALALQNIGMVDRADATWRAVCETATPAEMDLAGERISSGHDAWHE